MKKTGLGLAAFAVVVGFAMPLLGQNRGNRPGEAAATGPTTAPVAANVDEKESQTKQKIVLNGKTLNYSTTVAQMPLKDANGETEAHICYFAYTLDVPDKTKRPLTFCFNGGPGSASLWVHMGAMGPRKPVLMDNGDMPPPPYQIVDNPDTWLDQTDLVFIDPVGTGYSRAKNEAVARRMNGVQGDIASVGEFIRMYMTKNDRWLSPIFIAGESYGTFRSAGLAANLVDQGIAVNGIVLISTILNYGTSRPGLIHNLPYALFLPTYAADAWFHKKMAPDLQQKDLKTALKEVETWAMGGYMDALNKGSSLTDAERKATIDKLVRYTGLTADYLDNSDLRLEVSRFQRELMRDKRMTIGRLDGRLTGVSPLNTGETAEFDPSSTLIRPPFQAAFMHYMRTELQYKSDMVYNVSGGTMPWDWGTTNGFVDTTQPLRQALAKNPHMKVLMVNGYYDLATPYFATQYTMDHAGIHPSLLKNISWQYYEAGHMMYIDKASHEKLKKDVMAFMNSAMPVATSVVTPTPAQ